MRRFVGWSCLFIVAARVLWTLLPGDEALFYYIGLGVGWILLTGGVSIRFDD